MLIKAGNNMLILLLWTIVFTPLYLGILWILQRILKDWDKLEAEDKEKGVMSVIDCVEPLK